MIDVISKIADLQPDPKPNSELGVGRECYAFSETEDLAFQTLANEAEWLFLDNSIDSSAYNIQNDAIGNLFVTFYGTNRQETVMSGSHVDSVYKGGMYDGVAGVHSAFRLLEKLLKEGKTPERNYTVAVFRSEEASPKTGNTSVGSRIAAGTIKEQDFIKMKYKRDDGTSVLFKDFFIEKYGQKRWDAVLEELKNPPLRKGEIVAYEELHIEQSAVCELNDVDVGIVIDGIGGAIRQTVRIPFSSELVQSAEASPEQPQTLFRLYFTGEEAHSGGTPPNPSLTRPNKESLWYRKDALIGAARFVQTLMCSNFSDQVKVVNFNVPREVGFTTVPKEQTVEIMVPEDMADTFEKEIAEAGDIIEERYGVKLKIEKEAASLGTFQYFEPIVFDSLHIPFTVESAVRNKCDEQMEAGGGGVGKVRATVTDFRLEKSEQPTVQCNLDFRDVDPEAISKVISTVHDRIEQVSRDLMSQQSFRREAYHIVTTVSRKLYTPMDEQAIEDKSRIAGGLGYKIMKMPSLPGHDAASLGYLGIPITMTFVRHDGKSHTGFETMPFEYYEKAETISHTYLLEKLGFK